MPSDIAPDAIFAAEPAVKVRRSPSYYSLLALLVVALLLIVTLIILSHPRGWTMWDFDPRYWGMVAILIALIRRAVDRRPVLIVDAQGIHDRRLGSALLPWSDLRRAAYRRRSWGSARFGMHLHFRSSVRFKSLWQWGSTSDIYIWMNGLDITPAQFVEYVKRFAPHVALDTKMFEA